MSKRPDGSAANGAGRHVEARRIAGAVPVRASYGEFTYTVLLGPTPDGSDERRLSLRRRTRLRSAKIVDAEGRFVTECLMHDLSEQGGRLRLPPGVSVPRLIAVYDDKTGQLHEATVRWRRDRDLGVAFRPAAETSRNRRVAGEMRRKFYAVRD